MHNQQGSMNSIQKIADFYLMLIIVYILAFLIIVKMLKEQPRNILIMLMAAITVVACVIQDSEIKARIISRLLLFM